MCAVTWLWANEEHHVHQVRRPHAAHSAVARGRPEHPAGGASFPRWDREKRGLVANVYRALANHPALARTLVDLYATARGGGLTPAECELAYLSASTANECYY